MDETVPHILKSFGQRQQSSNVEVAEEKNNYSNTIFLERDDFG